MRILLVSNLYPPYWLGGYEQIAEWAAEGLRRRGHAVEVLTGRGAALVGRPEIHPDLDLDLEALCAMSSGAGIAFAPTLGEGLRRHVFNRTNYRTCLRLIERFHPDVASFWNTGFLTLSPLLAARRSRVPAVVHLSDVAFNPFRNPHAPAFPESLRGVARATVGGLLRLSRPLRFTVPSIFLKENLLRAEGLPASRMDLLPWPVGPAISATEPMARNGTPATRLLFVGSLIPEKGPDVLIAAFGRALAERSDLRLTIVGGGPRGYVDSLRQAASGLPVRFAGRLERPAVIEAYRSHDVLVFPSVWGEPFSLVPLEAMAMGLTVVATRTGGTPEAVVPEKTGLLVPPSDAPALAGAILRVVEDSPFARALAREGEAWARRTQGFERFLDRLESLYENCRDGGSRAGR